MSKVFKGFIPVKMLGLPPLLVIIIMTMYTYSAFLLVIQSALQSVNT